MPHFGTQHQTDLDLLQQEIGRTDLPEGSGLINPEREVELTPEIRRTRAVVNGARPQGRVQGVTNFLENPEVQNALLQFGRAFSKNVPSEPGTILADAGEQMLQGQAGQRALRAFEEGEDIAEAAGRFADPSLVAGLQERRLQADLAQQRLGLDEREFDEQVRQFDEEIDIGERLQTLREIGADRDFILNHARLNLDKDTFEARTNQLEQEFELDKRVRQSEIDYRNFLMSEEGQDQESFALRTNEFLSALQERELNLEDQVDLIQDTLEDFPTFKALGIGTTGAFGRIAFGIQSLKGPKREEALRRAAQQAGLSVQDVETAEVRAKIEKELLDTQTRLSDVRATQQGLIDAQSQRLGAGQSGEGQAVPGTRKQPLRAGSVQEMRGMPVGTIVSFGNQLYEITEGGARLLNEETE